MLIQIPNHPNPKQLNVWILNGYSVLQPTTVPQEIEKVLRCFEILGLDDFRQDSGQPDRVDVERNEEEEQESRDHFDQNL